MPRRGPSNTTKAYAQEDDARRMAAVLDCEPRGPATVLVLLGGTIHRDRRAEPNPPADAGERAAPPAEGPAPPR